MVSSCKFCKRGHFGGCTCCVASFRVAGVALRDIQTCSVTCRKSLCVWGRRGTFATFSEDALQFFFVAGGALWTHPSSFYVASAAL